MTTLLDISGLPGGWNCFDVEDGNIYTIPKDPNDGSPCGSNFNPTVGYFNLKTTAPWTGPCELKWTPDGWRYPAVLGQVAVNVAVQTNVSLVDPVPDLVSGNAVATSTQLQGLLNKGHIVYGAGADGVTQVVVRIDTNTRGHQFTITLVNDQGASGSSIIPSEDGALGLPGDASFSAGQVSVTAGSQADSNGLTHAFAIYRAPLDFARPVSGGGFKKGACGAVTNTGDDQLICRSVSLQIQDTTGNTAAPGTTIIIVRPPVILVHGLWGHMGNWDNFSPLVSGPNTADARFSVGRFNHEAVVGAQISGPSPAYNSVANAAENSLGFQYNAQFLYVDSGKWINTFKVGANNPANIAVAAVQADFVAHSMGGDVVRTMALPPTFLNDPARPTFGQGIVHKVITIDTPHLGSPLADLLLLQANACTRGILAGKGKYSFKYVTLASHASWVCGTQTNSVCGAIGDLSPSSSALNSINNAAQPQPHYLPTALIGGIYTNFASLNCTYCDAGLLRSSATGCPNDPLAQSLTGDGWPDNFGVTPDNRNDGIVPLSSQLNTTAANPDSSLGFQFTGYVHSQGTEGLSFTGPSVLDQGVYAPNGISVPNQVINLLNTPVTSQMFFLLNP